MSMEALEYHLVHANVAIMRAPWDDPRMANFLEQADDIDALAQASPGFIDQPSPADEGSVYQEPALLNLSIWQSVEALEKFTFGPEHAKALERREDWFIQYEGPNYVLFWLPASEEPTEKEVQTRLGYLASHGPTPYAFTFENRFSIREMLPYKPDLAGQNLT